MGLDQYLEASKYVGGWDHSQDTEKALYASIMTAMGKPGYRCEGSPSLTLKVNIGYWRKANAIHAWMVEHVQGGEDDCRPYHITEDQLRELRDLCQQVIDRSPMADGNVYRGTRYQGGKPGERMYEPGQIVSDPTVASELLPTQNGFFFGDTNYDEDYINDLKRTVTIVNETLSNFSADAGWQIFYDSSW